jgi:hypothetical protein
VLRVCGEKLDRLSKVGDEVLKDAGRLTTVGTLKNPIAQRVRTDDDKLPGQAVLSVMHGSRCSVQTSVAARSTGEVNPATSPVLSTCA